MEEQLALVPATRQTSGGSAGQQQRLEEGALTQQRELLGRTEQDAVSCSQAALRAKHDASDLVAHAHETHRAALRDKLGREHETEHGLLEEANNAEEQLNAFRIQRALQDDRETRSLNRASSAAQNAQARATACEQNAQELENRANELAQREDSLKGLVRGFADSRAEQAQANAALRVARAENRIAEVDGNLRSLDEAFDSHFQSIRRGVEAGFERKQHLAGAVQHDAAVKVRQAMDEASGLKASALREIMTSRRNMAEVITESKQNRWEALIECEAAIRDEDVCTQRSERMAREMTEAAMEFCEKQLKLKERELDLADAILEKAVDGSLEEVQVADGRLEARGILAEKEREVCIRHLEREAVFAEEKVRVMEDLIERYEGECKACRSRVSAEWSKGDNLGDSRRSANAADLAEQAIDDVHRRLREMEVRCAKRKAAAKEKGKLVVERAQQRLRSLEEIADSMVQGVTSASETQAEKLEADVVLAERVQASRAAEVEERIEAGRQRSAERVDMVRRRCEDEIRKAQRRREEAEDRRAKAKAFEEAAADRTRFAAAFLRATGFEHYVEEVLFRPTTPDQLEEEPALLVSEEEALAAAEEDLNAEGQDAPAAEEAQEEEPWANAGEEVEPVEQEDAVAPSLAEGPNTTTSEEEPTTVVDQGVEEDAERPVGDVEEVSASLEERTGPVENQNDDVRDE